MKQKLLIFIMGSIVVLSFMLGRRSISTSVDKTTSIDTTFIVNHDTDLDIIRQDLITYQKLSPATIKTVINSIDSASKKWSIPVGLLHAIFRVESEYNFWINHPTVTVTVNGKRIQTQAVGLGGIIWEFWADSLAKYNIANTRTDLYLPKNNINASAAILRWITNVKLKKNTTTEYNLINNIISGYYGAYDKNYHKKMERITSDLWLKRIAKVLFINSSKIDYKIDYKIDTLKTKATL